MLQSPGGWFVTGLAGTSTTFQLSATVVQGCEIGRSLAAGPQSLGTVGLVDFGTHSALSTDTLDASISQSSGFVLACTPGVSLSFRLNSGLNASGGRNLRQEGGAELQPYALYRDASRSQEFVPDQSYPLNIVDADPVVLPIFGRTTLGGQLPPGTYSDTVLLTLVW